MELRLDHLLTALRQRTADILRTIDEDDLLVKRESGDLVLANASKKLFTPTAEHHLYAKGIVYRRAPYRLVSLPLIKIYNLGEHGVTTADLAALHGTLRVQARFLRKVDGSLVQVFADGGRVWFTTRGMIEGATLFLGEDDEAAERKPDFDYLATARRLAQQKYPRLLSDPSVLEGRTLLFELIHPEARIITNYGDREDLVLLAAFDRERVRYLPHPELRALGEAHGLSPVDSFAPRGESLPDQIDDLLAGLVGTDQEGSVLVFESAEETVYRAKVKSPDYLRLLRLYVDCTYTRTAEFLDANPHIRSWPELEACLQQQGRDQVPEEVLADYRRHHDTYAAYLADCETLRCWAVDLVRRLEQTLGDREGQDPRTYRKAFAALATKYPFSALLFAAHDDRLEVPVVRKVARTPDEAREMIGQTNAGTQIR